MMTYRGFLIDAVLNPRDADSTLTIRIYGADPFIYDVPKADIDIDGVPMDEATEFRGANEMPRIDGAKRGAFGPRLLTLANFGFYGHGSIWLVTPKTAAARVWLRATAPDDAQWFGESLAVEPRYVEGVMAAITDMEVVA